jgi:hypothetical protein
MLLLRTTKKDIVFAWGWITKEGIRETTGSASKVKPDDIVGIWGRMIINNMVTYNEVWLKEYQIVGNTSSWEIRPLAMLIKTCYEQTYNLACVGKRNVLFESEVFTALKPAGITTTEKFQRWVCKGCGHTFYTNYTGNNVILDKIKSLFRKSIAVECEVCYKIKAIHAGIKTTKSP